MPARLLALGLGRYPQSLPGARKDQINQAEVMFGFWDSVNSGNAKDELIPIGRGIIARTHVKQGTLDLTLRQRVVSHRLML